MEVGELTIEADVHAQIPRCVSRVEEHWAFDLLSAWSRDSKARGADIAADGWSGCLGHPTSRSPAQREDGPHSTSTFLPALPSGCTAADLVPSSRPIRSDSGFEPVGGVLVQPQTGRIWLRNTWKGLVPRSVGGITHLLPTCRS